VPGAVRGRSDILAVIAAGGALGALARWGLAVAVPRPPGGFPWATFTANVTGCLLIGLLMVFVVEVWPPRRLLRPFLGVGVLGGYTTFSAYALDALRLATEGHLALAGAYLLASIVAGLVAVWLAVVVARALATRAVRLREEDHDG
jgi:CrcB protein